MVLVSAAVVQVVTVIGVMFPCNARVLSPELLT